MSLPKLYHWFLHAANGVVATWLGYFCIIISIRMSWVNKWKNKQWKEKVLSVQKRVCVTFYLSNDLLIENVIDGSLELQPIPDIFKHLCNCEKPVHSYLCMVFCSVARHLSSIDLNTWVVSHCTNYSVILRTAN